MVLVTSNSAISEGSAEENDATELKSKALPPALNEAFFGARIQRTMTLLSTSNERLKRSVKILFYGQSVVAGMHWEEIIYELQKRFPYTDIISENRAIGGYTAPSLVRPAVHDLYPFYPDLVIFHVYSAYTGEWERIIHDIRKYTTAEIMVFTHHVADRSDRHDLQWRTKRDDENSDMIRYIAQKYNCELVEVREEWKNYLKVNGLEQTALLRDHVHPNSEGHNILAQLILRHFRLNTFSPGGWYNTVKTYEIRRAIEEKNDRITFTGIPWQSTENGAVAKVKGNSVKLEFTGNRVDVVSFPYSGKLGTAKVLIDERPPSTFPELYYCTRPSRAHSVWWPAIRRVTLGPNPVAEKWTLTITKINDDADDFEFELEGSASGKDGRGNNKEQFISDSGRIIIQPEDFTIRSAQNYKKTKCPANFTVTWEVKPNFVDIWQPRQKADPAMRNIDTLFQGAKNVKHTLELVPNGDGVLPVSSIIVHTPPLKE